MEGKNADSRLARPLRAVAKAFQEFDEKSWSDLKMSGSLNPAEILFRPMNINKLTIKNRIVMGPMAVLQPLPDGRPSEQTIAFFVERAKGGIGLIIVGGRGYEERGFPLMRLDREDFVPDLKMLADAVHTHGTPIFGQINTGFGRMGMPSKERQPISASPLNVVIKEEHFPRGIVVPGGISTPTPREATVEEIHDVESQTTEAALRLKRAGFDGVEILAHVSYFVASFLSSWTNWRTDEHGGSEENRARILVNIVRMIRERAGAHFPIGIRITCNEHVEGSQPPAEYASIVRIIERAGRLCRDRGCRL